MSFLIDPPWLYATGRAAAPHLDEPTAKKLGAATIAVFWGTSISLYLDKRWTTPIWKLCRARSGRDWMLNSGVFHFPYKRVGRGTHVVSALLFASYPLWLWLGYERARQHEG
jgi:hypothetical protein